MGPPATTIILNESTMIERVIERSLKIFVSYFELLLGIVGSTYPKKYYMLNFARTLLDFKFFRSRVYFMFRGEYFNIIFYSIWCR